MLVELTKCKLGRFGKRAVLATFRRSLTQPKAMFSGESGVRVTERWEREGPDLPTGQPLHCLTYTPLKPRRTFNKRPVPKMLFFWRELRIPRKGSPVCLAPCSGSVLGCVWQMVVNEMRLTNGKLCLRTCVLGIDVTACIAYTQTCFTCCV